MAISQAWVLGGRHGCWPRGSWQARHPEGPRILELDPPRSAKPDSAWVARLRHGSSSISPSHRGKSEDEVSAWAWEALLDGDGAPWMALGSLLLDRSTRLKWVAPLGATDPEGFLHLPPWLEILLPQPLLKLPPGWWDCLLGRMDGEGRLLPGDAPASDSAFNLLRDLGPEALQPLVGKSVPPPMGAWPLPGLGWMLPPEDRAWARGWGATPEQLQRLREGSLADGGTPDEMVQDILQHRLPGMGLSPEWQGAIGQVLDGAPMDPVPPPVSHPTLMCIRARWSDQPLAPLEGYPPLEVQAHPCADPFHWMARGYSHFTQGQVVQALRAFSLAHAHFRRLGSLGWARRAAGNAWQASALWADPSSLKAWEDLKGSVPEPQASLEASISLGVQGDYPGAAARLGSLLEHPQAGSTAACLLGSMALCLDRRDLASRCLPQLPPSPQRSLLRAFLGLEPISADLLVDPECCLVWGAHLARSGEPLPDGFWDTWEHVGNQVVRVDTGLLALKHRPQDRLPTRLLALQAITDRTRSATRKAQLAELWPKPLETKGREGAEVVCHWLRTRSRPTWVLTGKDLIGPNAEPPEGLLGRLKEAGAVSPLAVEDSVWWGGAIQWEGAPVAHYLTCSPLGQPLPEDSDLALVAPWLAQMRPLTPPEPVEEGNHLLWDGSEPMASVMADAVRMAPTQIPLLILGPTGTGKELLARDIHTRSGRPGELIPVNCSAIAEGLLESELFGHVKGAFTGADRDRKGAVEMAEHGTLFLDEVADIGPRVQSLLLRVLQEREVRRVGSDQTRRVDVRFLAATHKDLASLIAAGAFRQDLLYRLQGGILVMPSLAERRHEIPALLPRLISLAALDLRRSPPSLAPGLGQALAQAAWPGNFRQLRHALERGLLRCGDGPLGPEHFPELESAEPWLGTWDEAHKAFQRQLLQSTLQRHRWQISEAARELGLSRPALYVALRRVGIDILLERSHQESVSPRSPTKPTRAAASRLAAGSEKP